MIVEKNNLQDQRKDTIEILLNTYMDTLKPFTESPFSMNDDTSAFFKKNINDFNLVLNNLHDMFNIGRKYREEKVFEAFPTLGDAYEYLAIQTMINDGIIDTKGL